MTRDEAIDYLLDPIGKREKHDEAIHMAIKALKRDVINTNVGDTIYKQATIDAINALHEEPNAWLDSAVDAVMTLPTAQSEQRWIPCSERLPGDGERVLVTTKNGEVLFGSHLGKYWAFGSKVLAWMPLPEPYQESKQNE